MNGDRESRLILLLEQAKELIRQKRFFMTCPDWYDVCVPFLKRIQEEIDMSFGESMDEILDEMGAGPQGEYLDVKEGDQQWLEKTLTLADAFDNSVKACQVNQNALKDSLMGVNVSTLLSIPESAKQEGRYATVIHNNGKDYMALCSFAINPVTNEEAWFIQEIKPVPVVEIGPSGSTKKRQHAHS